MAGTYVTEGDTTNQTGSQTQMTETAKTGATTIRTWADSCWDGASSVLSTAWAVSSFVPGVLCDLAINGGGRGAKYWRGSEQTAATVQSKPPSELTSNQTDQTDQTETSASGVVPTLRRAKYGLYKGLYKANKYTNWLPTTTRTVLDERYASTTTTPASIIEKSTPPTTAPSTAIVPSTFFNAYRLGYHGPEKYAASIDIPSTSANASVTGTAAALASMGATLASVGQPSASANASCVPGTTPAEFKRRNVLRPNPPPRSQSAISTTATTVEPSLPTLPKTSDLSWAAYTGLHAGMGAKCLADEFWTSVISRGPERWRTPVPNKGTDASASMTSVPRA